ncbi:putative RNA-binding protein [Smittium culicis]|nr:putative RNA-binding protein [Smittium culicis]
MSESLPVSLEGGISANSECDDNVKWAEQISKDPYNYELYIGFLDQFSKLKDINSTRELISIMKDRIAISPDIDLYLEYLNFIDSLSSENINSTYEFSTSEDNTTNWALEWKNSIWEKAVQATQYHYTSSHKIWNIFFDKMKEQVETITNPEEKLSVPHQKIEETFSIYSMFVTTYMVDSYEEIMVQVNSIKSDTIKKSQNRESYERKLDVSTTGQSNEFFLADQYYVWVNYIKYLLVEFEKFNAVEISENFNQIPEILEILTVAERMVINQYSNPKSWIFYFSLLIKFNKDINDLISVINRSVRNCPWSGEINGYSIMFDLENVDSNFENVLKYKILNYSAIEMANFLLARMATGKTLYLDGIG